MRVEAYRLAQRSLADLKTAVLMILEAEGKQGLRNVDIGRALGIYSGHKGHEGHIPRTLLAMMAGEGLVHQDEKSRMWFLSPGAENPVE